MANTGFAFTQRCNLPIFGRMIKSKNPDYKNYVKYKISRNKFMRHLGFEITTIQAGYIEGELNIESCHEQQNGMLHGGVTSTLCDIVAGFASYSVIGAEEQVFTVEIKISYLRPGIGKKVKAKGQVIKAGRRFIFSESELWMLLPDGQETMIAKASTTMAVR